MKKLTYTFGLIVLLSIPTFGQSYAFGVKGGLVAGTQRFNGANNKELLFGYHGDAFIETADEEDKFSLFAQAGYHQRGHAVRFIGGYNPWSNTNFPNAKSRMVFHNAALILGGKQKFDWSFGKYYYAIGVRGEYTFDWNLGYLNNRLTNQDQLVRNFMYGVSFSLGGEIPFSELVSGILELSVHPDVSKQMFFPQQTVQDRNGNLRNIKEQNIFNVSVELTAGIRFLHLIEIID